MLNIMAPKNEQLAILIPYLEANAELEKPAPLPVSNSSLVLMTRYLRGWKDVCIPAPPSLTLEGAFRLYLLLEEKDK